MYTPTKEQCQLQADLFYNLHSVCSRIPSSVQNIAPKDVLLAQLREARADVLQNVLQAIDDGIEMLENSFDRAGCTCTPLEGHKNV